MRQHDAFDNYPTMADLAESLKDCTSTKLSHRTAQPHLHERNYKKCLKTRKPFITTVIQCKRVQFAKRYCHWTVDQCMEECCLV